jgi:hypothetical protein
MGLRGIIERNGMGVNPLGYQEQHFFQARVLSASSGQLTDRPASAYNRREPETARERSNTMREIRITAGEVSATAILNDSATADAIWEALPLEARGSTWGDEIYFGIPIYLDEANDALEVVELGDLGYWSPGHAFCIFFGPTPMSLGNEIRPASAVNIFGQVQGDPTVFTEVESGTRVRIERA